MFDFFYIFIFILVCLQNNDYLEKKNLKIFFEYFVHYLKFGLIRSINYFFNNNKTFVNLIIGDLIPCVLSEKKNIWMLLMGTNMQLSFRL